MTVHPLDVGNCIQWKYLSCKSSSIQKLRHTVSFSAYYAILLSHGNSQNCLVSRCESMSTPTAGLFLRYIWPEQSTWNIFIVKSGRLRRILLPNSNLFCSRLFVHIFPTVLFTTLYKTFHGSDLLQKYWLYTTCHIHRGRWSIHTFQDKLSVTPIPTVEAFNAVMTQSRQLEVAKNILTSTLPFSPN